MTTYDEAQAALDALEAKQTSWEQKRDQIAAARNDLQRSAGAMALEGGNTGKIADQLSRLTSEYEIATSALATLDTQVAAARIDASLARIADERAKAVAVLQEGAEKEAAIKPHLDAIEALTGLRYNHIHTPGMVAALNAHRLLGFTERAEDRLPDDVRDRLFAQRDMAPTEVDKAIQQFRQPQQVAA